MTARSLADVEYNYKLINERIAEAAQKIGKTREDITFLAATKTVDAATINHAISLGLDHIGENRVQELRFVGGCDGNHKGLNALVKGMKAEEAIERLSGITCGFRPTSCPDQVAVALRQANLS